MLAICKADSADVFKLAPLFDAYRVFYGKNSDFAGANDFLTERVSRGESIILLALWSGEAIGFTQLYTTFSSVSMKPFYILNDLYVNPEFRGKGVGRQLMEEAKKICIHVEYKGLALETAMDNPAQHLYEKLGWKKDSEYFHYFWTNPNQN